MTDPFIPAEPPAKPRHPVLARLRAYFLAGILVTAPISITLYIAYLIVNFFDRNVGGLLPEAWNPGTYLPIGLPGLGLVMVLVGLTLIGWLTAGYVGNAVVRAGETVLARMPVVRGLYTATKQIFQTVLSNRSNAFREVVMIQWPREGVWTIGFVSTPPNRQIQSYVGDDVVSVFITTTPIPTYGYLMFVKRSEVRPVDMSVDEAMKIIISGGLVMPPDREMAVSKPAPADGAAAPAPGLAEQTAR